MIDKSDKLKLVAFDISCNTRAYNTGFVFRVNEVREYSIGYASPEVVSKYEHLRNIYKKHQYRNEDEMKEKEENNNEKKEKVKIPEFKTLSPWKSDIYSCGIIALLLSSAISLDEIYSLDVLKENENIHKGIESFVEKSIWEDENGPNEVLTKKMKLIIKQCISFKPENRINFHVLRHLIKTINKSSIEEINQYLSDYFKSPKETIGEMKLYMNNLEDNYNKMKNKFVEIEKNYNELKNKINLNNRESKMDRNINTISENESKNISETLIEMENMNHILMKDFEDYKKNLNFTFNKEDPNTKIWKEIQRNIIDLLKALTSLRKNLIISDQNKEKIDHSQNDNLKISSIKGKTIKDISNYKNPFK